MDPPLMVSVLGYAAATLTTLSFFPQAIQTVRSGDTRAFSLPSRARPSISRRARSSACLRPDGCHVLIDHAS